MDWRKQELNEFSEEIIWLSSNDAYEKYVEALNYCSKSKYGLNELSISDIELFNIESDASELEVSPWLVNKIGHSSQELLIAYSEVNVAELSTVFFIQNWRELFLPARDDVIILPKSDKWIMFYCHEDFFEFGLRR